MANRIVTITVNTDLLTMSLDSVPFAIYPETFDARVTFVDADGDAVALTGKSLQFSAKDPDALDGADFLFSSTYSEDSGDTWSDLSAGKALFTIDTNTTELTTFLDDDLTKTISVSVKNITDDIVLGILQESFSVKYGIITGDEGSPTSAIRVHNFSASRAPTTTDDSSDRYAVGSLWFDVSANKAYTCVDATVDAAIWLVLGRTASEIKTAYESNADTNAFTDAQVTKLAGISTGADVTATALTAAGISTVQDTPVEISAVEIDWTASKNQYKTTSADDTYTFANAFDGGVVTVVITASGADRTPTFPAGIVWATGAVPGAITSGKTLAVTFIQMNSVVYASFLENMGTP